MRKILYCSAVFLAAGLVNVPARAAATEFTIAGNTPRFVAQAQKIADVDASQVIDVTLWLNPPNRAALDAKVARLYDRTSPEYRHFLTREALAHLIAPSDADMQSITDFAQAHGLKIVLKDKLNLFVRVRGSAEAMQAAFNTKLAHVSFKGQIYRVNLTDPVIKDAAGAHVMAVEGLDDMKVEHHYIAQATALPHGRAVARGGSAFSNVCFATTGSETFTSGGAPPTGTFTGNIYAPGTNICGYTPPQIQAAYGLNALYSAGLDGAGQTIVIVDWCGSPTITGDANAFSTKYGLPALTSSNFAIVDYPGQSSCAAPDPEINIDVEWSHAIAPGANIVLLVPPTANFQDIDSSWVYIIENDFANIGSNSYGSEELYTPLTILQLQSYILESAAAEGISMNFSSGDDGDYTFDGPYTPSVIAPADSPYAVAVGGISLSLNSSNAIQWQGPWGTNETLISDQGDVPVPAANFGFGFGGGGGSSALFAKPSYQSQLRGKFRKLPDISWLADPFTGGVIAISEPFVSPALEYTVYGGTSLAAPMFSGLWAIANQAAGQDLGLASPFLYGAPSGTITDITPVGSTTNVTAAYLNNGVKSHEGAAALAQPLNGNKTFVSAIWNYPDNQDLAYIITFGTDSGLKAAPGWDDATGLGVANPAALVSLLQSSP